MSRLFPTCKETSRLLTHAVDARLSTWERLQMRLHISICRNCSIFERQLRQMTQWLALWREKEDGLPGEARRRIREKLEEKGK